MIYTGLFWLQLGAAVLQAGLALYVLRFRNIPAATPFAMVMALTAFVAVNYALDLSTASLPLKILWMNLRITVTVLLPLGFLWLVLEYVGQGAWLTRRRLALLLVVPILTIVLTWTGGYHSWYRYNFQVNLDAPFPLLIWDGGPMHWVVQWYTIVIEVGAIWVLVRAFRVRALYAQNTLILILGILAPSLANGLFTIGITPWRGFNPTSIALVLTSPLLAWAILRLRLFDVAPVARSAAMEAIDDLVFVLDTHGHLVDFNRAVQAACGLVAQAGGAIPETLPLPWADLFRRYPDLSTGKEQVTLDCGEGPRAYDLMVSLVHDARGRALGRLFLLHDVTERNQAEEIIQLRLRLLEFAADHSLLELMRQALDEIGLITHSPIGFYHFVEADQKTLSLQAWSTRTLEEFCTAEGAGLHYGLDQAGVWVDCVYQRRPVIHNDYAALPHRKGMPPGHAEVRRELVVPIMREGRIVSILGVGNKPAEYDDRDVALVSYVADIVWTIVERKRAQEALSQYAEQLAVRNAELDAFAHTVAHDLQNPLSIVIGFGQLLVDDLDTMSPPEVAKAAYHVLRNGQKLSRIIEDLMLLSGIRQQEITPEPLDMGVVAGEAIDQLEPLIQKRQARITLEDGAAWPVALGYAPWIEHVWDNYISNAIKYAGQPPQIQIGADRVGLAGLSGEKMARFWVQDNGAGLSAEAQASLFTPFTRLDQAHIQGHGLGLSIVRRIVENLGGQVGVESQPGQGSRFFFTLPLAEEVSGAAEPLEK
ncbi:MAG: GAF domain-containing protein [Anaerolineae bacterium]|nr:GAF domain-containing protein [Anaerolineae bacterium]